jgi:predicted protein tyrosine phosphatase
MNILFVCSMARMRSKTAAHCLQSVKHPTKYCGLDKTADIVVASELVEWADKIICMGTYHRSKLRKKFRGLSHKIEVWNIEDIYNYMDDSLVSLLRWEYERRGYYD